MSDIKQEIRELKELLAEDLMEIRVLKDGVQIEYSQKDEPFELIDILEESGLKIVKATYNGCLNLHVTGDCGNGVDDMLVFLAS
jgi:hypothetical protein